MYTRPHGNPPPSAPHQQPRMRSIRRALVGEVPLLRESGQAEGQGEVRITPTSSVVPPPGAPSNRPTAPTHDPSFPAKPFRCPDMYDYRPSPSMNHPMSPLPPSIYPPISTPNRPPLSTNCPENTPFSLHMYGFLPPHTPRTTRVPRSHRKGVCQRVAVKSLSYGRAGECPRRRR